MGQKGIKRGSKTAHTGLITRMLHSTFIAFSVLLPLSIVGLPVWNPSLHHYKFWDVLAGGHHPSLTHYNLFASGTQWVNFKKSAPSCSLSTNHFLCKNILVFLLWRCIPSVFSVLCLACQHHLQSLVPAPLCSSSAWLKWMFSRVGESSTEGRK